MKRVAPDYYGDFACLMGACRHSCCVGWEIDIDAPSLERYRSVPGDAGARLRESIRENDDGACFRLSEDERCPFLNDAGLCDLILELGEDSLCQICADHPRYRNFFPDREEIGLGLCCEAAGGLILGGEGPVEFVVLDDDGSDDSPGEDGEIVLALRGELMQIAQEEAAPADERIRRMLDAAQLEMGGIDLADWAAFLLELERLDENWALRLRELMVGCADEGRLAKWEGALGRLMVYLLHRHLPGAMEDDDLSGRIAYAILIWKIIRAMCALRKEALNLEEMIEICRLYSSEIEYSDENVAAILDRLHEIYPEL